MGRAEIAEHVWDESFDPFSNLIEVYVDRPRRKIDEGARCRYCKRDEAAATSSRLPWTPLRRPRERPQALHHRAVRGNRMLDSVRVRLTVWYTAVVAMVLILLACLTYFLYARNIAQRTDSISSN